MYSIRRAAAEMGVSERTVARLIARGDLEVVRPPGVRRTLISPESVAQLLHGSAATPTR